jgi:hypothetical protein
MQKPLAIKIITALTFLAPLNLYLTNPAANALSLAIVAGITTPTAIGLHHLRRKARIALLVILYVITALELIGCIAAPPNARPILELAAALYGLCIWYMHRPSIRVLFEPERHDPYSHWRKREMDNPKQFRSRR